MQSPLLDHCPPTLPATAYYDPAVYDLEQRRIWSRHWVYAGRASDQPPMSLRRVSVAGQSLILVKDAGGAFTCFHNTCRHRGAELCRPPEQKLASRLIVCPYHQWSYGLDGRLMRTPYVVPTADFRKQEHGLLPVHVMDWHGFILVCLADEPPPLTVLADAGKGTLDNWPIASLVTGHTLVTEIACNWKVFWENYNECLHCPGIHPSLCDMVPVYGRAYMDENEAPDWTPDTPRPAHVLKPGAVTWTVSGEPCGPTFPALTAAERAAGHTFATLLPAMYVVAHVDYVRAVSLRPLAPERTELKAEWLFPAETLAAPGFDLDNVVRFAATVIAEDGAASEMNQRGLRSSRYTRGTLMPQEYCVHQFQEWVRQQTA